MRARDRERRVRAVFGAFRKLPEAGHLIARKNGVLCTICGELESVHGGESGTPLPSLLAGYLGSIRRHPPTKHERVFGR